MRIGASGRQAHEPRRTSVPPCFSLRDDPGVEDRGCDDASSHWSRRTIGRPDMAMQSHISGEAGCVGCCNGDTDGPAFCRVLPGQCPISGVRHTPGPDIGGRFSRCRNGDFSSVRSRWSRAVLDCRTGLAKSAARCDEGVSKVTASVSIRLAPGGLDHRRAHQPHSHGLRSKRCRRARDPGSGIAGPAAETPRVGGTRRPTHQDAAR